MSEREARRITVTGIVQGVGFRPFVYNLATRLGLTGWVLNHSGGVEIEIEGPAETLDAFITHLRAEAPPLAQIVSLEAHRIPPSGASTFTIRRSERQEGHYQLISPDVATCPDCLRELFDPSDRRYRYPFINCTNCGPRFTIIAEMPYDRPNTTMRVFPMCPDCRREYEDPRDRRFHAQPNACPVCGPHIWLTDAQGHPLVGSEAEADTEAVLARTKALLLAGQIVAVKGLGGFLLACDATNAEAVEVLRRRKRRPHKPFAVMIASLEETARHVELTPAAERLLTSPQAPIVLLPRRPNSPIAENVAPNCRTLGIMLPYTPLHHILLHDVGRPLVMTSGNLTEEPIARTNEEALRRLGNLADAFLLHNREIYSRYDDSVWHVIRDDNREIAQPIRRARGYAPMPIALPFEAPTHILAVGPELKATFCLVRERNAFVGQHIGDMENAETLAHYEETLALYQRLFHIEPRLLVHDRHPDYLTTQLAREIAQELAIETVAVQHHAAHIAACLADNGWPPEAGPVIGVAFDGTGYGDDGAIWGGEWLIGNYRGFERAAHLAYLPLPGGDAAIRHPWRIAAAYLYTALGRDRVPPDLLPPADRELFFQQIERRINTPPTSSMGRLFDAVSALVGVCREASYEAQAAIELEHRAPPPDGRPLPPPYPFGVEEKDSRLIVNPTPLIEAITAEVQTGLDAGTISLRFHVTIAQMIVTVCEQLRARTGIETVALSGGCFQNRLLLELALDMLRAAGFSPLIHRQVPCNDGGVSLGQAAIAAAKRETR